MRYKKHISVLLVLFLIAAANVQSFAQCAMCKTSLESDMNNGGSIANGLNTGILYLMAIPYIVLMIGGYFFFRKQIDAKVKVLWSKYFPAKAAK